MEAFSIARDRPLISFRFCREITVTRTKLIPQPAKFFGLAFFFLLPRFFRSRKLSRKQITSIRIVISFFTAVCVCRSSTKRTSKFYGDCVFGKVQQNERESKQFKDDDVTDQWFVIFRLHIFEWQHRNSTRNFAKNNASSSRLSGPWVTFTAASREPKNTLVQDEPRDIVFYEDW